MAAITLKAILEVLTIVAQLIAKIPDIIEEIQDFSKDREYQKKKKELQEAVDGFVKAKKNKDIKGQLKNLEKLR